jgi:hypothetical protein
MHPAPHRAAQPCNLLSVNPLTAPKLDSLLSALDCSAGGMMTGKIDLLTASTALGVASYVAMILECLAHQELHLSDGQICRYAVAGALLISAATAAGHLRGGAGHSG